MKHLFTIIFLLLVGSAYSQIKEHKCPDKSIFRKQEIDNEIVCMCLQDSLLNGMTIVYYKNGKKKEENNWTLGVKTGVWKEWNKNAILTYEVNYLDGLKDGTEIFYFDNGNAKVLTTFKKDAKDGRIAEWFENGIQNTEGYFKNEVQHGTWMFRMPDNKTVTVVKFDNGKEVSVKDIEWTKKDLPKDPK